MGETPKGRAGRRLDTDVDFQGQVSDVAELRFRSVCARRRSSAANANVHGVAPPMGRAAGCARGERRWSTDFGPEIVGVSIGWALVARPGGRCRARCGGRGRGLLEQRSPRRVGTRVHRPGSVTRVARSGQLVPADFGPMGQVGGDGGLLRSAVWSRTSGGNTAKASILFAESVFLGFVWTLRSRLRLMSCRAPWSTASRGFAPTASKVAV